MKTFGMRSLLMVLIFGLVIGSVGCATVQIPSPSEKAVASAKTKADHEAVAQSYEGAAATAKTEAQKHRNLAESYHRAPAGRGEGTHGMASHCENLANLYEKAAEEYMELAKAHGETATDMK